MTRQQLLQHVGHTLQATAVAGGFGTVWIGEHHSMEYTVSPSHTGSVSFESVHGGVMRSYDLRSTIQIGLFCPPR